MKLFVWVLVAAILVGEAADVFAADLVGRVTYNGVPVPGVTVTARQADHAVVATTDEDGLYSVGNLADGVWNLTIEMLGFKTIDRQVTIPTNPTSAPIALVVQSLDELSRVAPPVTVPSGTFPRVLLLPSFSAGPTFSARPTGVPRVVDLATLVGPLGMGAADGLLINGSLNNGASTPFALPRAIGNNRPRPSTVRTYAFGMQLGNSAWDAAPFSFTGTPAKPPAHTDATMLGMFESPVRVPGLRNAATLTLQYQGSSATTANTQSARMPTDRERAGDFSQTLDAHGSLVRVVDPATGELFLGNVIPAERIAPEAAALLAYYPHADPESVGQFNFQSPLIGEVEQQSVKSGANFQLTPRHAIGVIGSYQRTGTRSTSLLAFDDVSRASTANAQTTWTWTRSRNTTVTTRYTFTHSASDSVPSFANRTNVSGDAGIVGNDQDPRNWGPPTLRFASGLATLTDQQSASTTENAHAWALDLRQTRGLHTVGVGGEFRVRRRHVMGQQDARGSFGFTGAATGVDFADFLLGLPQTSAIAFGDQGRDFRGRTAAAYLMDDWRIHPTLTLIYGLRWEYESPVTDARGRLANLEIAPGFVAASPVLAGGKGPLTGREYSNGLLEPDARGFEPRAAVAWRPRLGSSLVIRAGYGLSRATDVYQPIASLLGTQPPLSTTFNLSSTTANPLTLANGFAAPVSGALTTFAVDPLFRVPIAHTWDTSVQRDLPRALTLLISYQGTRGVHLMQMLLPNTYPVGADNLCPTCLTGFRFLTSGGRSNRNAVSVQLRRRLGDGFAFTLQYTLAKAMDDAAAFEGATLDGAALMQDWLHPEAEYARSSFDQRHLLTASAEHTTGSGTKGGTLLQGWKGRLANDWTFASTFSIGSGLPLTPVYFAPVGLTGVIGSLRPDITGVPDTPTAGAYANVAAFAAPAPGHWGDAPRNSITGPLRFSLNAAISRTFRPGGRLNFDWRIEATNVLNRVTYASVTTLVTSPQFGLANRANDMRRVRINLRVRF